MIFKRVRITRALAMAGLIWTSASYAQTREEQKQAEEQKKAEKKTAE
jgi:hypothetical protein